MGEPYKSKILVVDDEAMNIELLHTHLKTNYEVIAATNGYDALKTVKSERPDIILLDVMMPDMSGYEVCKRLKQDFETQFIPVIIVTALCGRNEWALGFEAGADEVLTKPVVRVELDVRIKSLLRAKSLYNMELRANRATSGREKVLIVGNDKALVQRMESFLREDYEIIKAYSGPEGIKEALLGRPSVIILDAIMTPIMNGYIVCKALKELVETSSIPIIITTVLENNEEIEKALDSGANEFLNKPINRNELKLRVRALTTLVTDVKGEAISVCKKAKGTDAESIACSVKKKVQEWEIGSQEKMKKSLDELISYLKLQVPNIPENEEIIYKINNVKNYNKVEDQILAITLIISCIPTISFKKEILDIKREIKTILDNTDHLGVLIKQVERPVDTSIREEIQVTFGLSGFGSGVQHIITIPLQEISYPGLKEDLKKHSNTMLDVAKIPERLKDGIMRYIKKNEEKLEEMMD